MSGQSSANKFINMFEQNIQRQKQYAQNNPFENKINTGQNAFIIKKNSDNARIKIMGQPISPILPQKVNNNIITIPNLIPNEQSIQLGGISVKDKMKMFQQQKKMENKPVNINPIVKQLETPIHHYLNNQTKIQQPIVQTKSFTDVSSSELIQSIQQQIKPSPLILTSQQIKKIQPYQTSKKTQESLPNHISQVKYLSPIPVQNISLKQRIKMMQQKLQNTMEKYQQIKQVPQIVPHISPTPFAQQIHDETLLKIVRTKNKRKNVPKFDSI